MPWGCEEHRNDRQARELEMWLASEMHKLCRTPGLLLIDPTETRRHYCCYKSADGKTETEHPFFPLRMSWGGGSWIIGIVAGPHPGIKVAMADLGVGKKVYFLNAYFEGKLKSCQAKVVEKEFVAGRVISLDEETKLVTIHREKDDTYGRACSEAYGQVHCEDLGFFEVHDARGRLVGKEIWVPMAAIEAHLIE